MTRPSQITNPADVHALVDEIGPSTALDLALGILARESGCFALFLRTGDDDPPRDDGKRMFTIGIKADDDLALAKLREVLSSWAVSKPD